MFFVHLLSRVDPRGEALSIQYFDSDIIYTLYFPRQVSNMSTDWVGYGYAALIASGGAIGYVKAGLCCTRYEVKGYDY